VGALTESMTRLRDEIVLQRRQREAFQKELVGGSKARRDRVSGLRAAFARDLAGARAIWAAPAALRAAVPKETCDVGPGFPGEPREELPSTLTKTRRKAHGRDRRKH